jgi:hemoglobin/transferrin/lactoferrin receptor protein
MAVTATRSASAVADLPHAVEVIDAGDLARQMPVTMPDALEGLSGVLTQKTSNGQTSPYIRGFTGFRNLLLVDGIRLNNSTFRDGPNQYWTMVDAWSLERLELVRGPAGVVFGSDAVGGTVNAITLPTGLSLSPNTWERHLYLRGGSGDRGLIGRMDVRGNVAGRLGYSLGLTGKDMGDIRAGDDTGTQEHTGYHEWDGDLKLECRLTDGQTLVLAHQHVDQDDVWRTHRTVYASGWHGTAVGTDRENSFDQNRDLTYLQYHGRQPASWLDELQAGISWQEMDEEEFRLRNTLRREQQGVHVNTLGAFLTAVVPSAGGRWTLGGDWYHDRVDSWRRTYNPDGSLRSIGLQGPVADAATYDLGGLFVQDEIPLGERAEVTLGVRQSIAQANADKVANPSGGRMRVDDDWQDTIGQARLKVGLDKQRRWNWFLGIGQAFRAPNLSDLTRFDTARSNEIETPSPGLDPEQYLCFETGIKGTQGAWSGQVVLFHTDIRDMIVRTPTGNVIDGKDEVTKKNAGEGVIDGLEVEIGWQVTPEWRLTATATWLDGDVDGYPTSAPVTVNEPISRLMPPTARLAATYVPSFASGRWSIEVRGTFADKQDDLSASDAADTQRIPPGGTPGYGVLDLTTSYALTETSRITLALENILDQDYRIHGSGVNEPGRNLVVALETRF